MKIVRTRVGKVGIKEKKMLMLMLMFVYTKHTIFLAILGQQEHMPLNTNTGTTGKLKLKNLS